MTVSAKRVAPDVVEPLTLGDKQDVFITEINQSDHPDLIEVSNEHGQTFEVNIVTGKVTQTDP